MLTSWFKKRGEKVAELNLSNDTTSQVTVNGETISVAGGRIVVKNGEVFVDGKVVSTYDTFSISPVQIKIVVQGDAESVYSQGSITVEQNVTSDLEAMGSVQIGGSVEGNIDTSGSVSIGGNMEGDIDASGNVQIKGSHIGSIDASGNVKIGAN